MAVFWKKMSLFLPLHLSMDLTYLHTIVGFQANVSSELNFQLSGLKVKATVAISFKKKNVITLAPAFINGP